VVPPDGYAWWYVDGLSEDGSRGVSVIAFIGSVFSPWYAWSGRRDPANHCCLNVALYGPGGRWTMTDRGRTALHQAPGSLVIGPSAITWDGAALTIEIDERSVPRGDRVQGRIVVRPEAVTDTELTLHPNGAHRWRPFAPNAAIEVAIDRRSGWQWRGHGYFDANFGTRALEADFRTWTWARMRTKAGTVCLYDGERRDGSRFSAALRFDGGRCEAFEPPPPAALPRSRWWLARETRADPGTRPEQVLPMLDAPFYCRSAIRARIGGEEAVGVHETLDLDRFASRWIKPMLALRVPRRAG
jgi:carotenoid 1,2-hydratase